MKKELLVNGEKYDPNPPTKRHLEIKKFLDDMDSEVLDTKNVLKRLGIISSSAFDVFAGRFTEYVYKTPNRTYYGNPESIRRFRALHEKSRAK